jgi:hypothetical protein
MQENGRPLFESPGRSHTEQVLGSKEQIEVILAEYSSREDEKNVVAQGLVNTLTFAIVVLTGLMAFIFEARMTQLWLLVPAVVLIFLGLETQRQFSVLYSNMYIGLLEEKVNRLAGERLLLWEHSTSIYHHYLRRFRIEQSAKGRRMINLGALIILLYVLAALGVLVWGLLEAGWWLVAKLPYSSTCNTVFIILYELGHVLILAIILLNRFVQQRKVLRTLEAKLRNEVLGD